MSISLHESSIIEGDLAVDCVGVSIMVTKLPTVHHALHLRPCRFFKGPFNEIPNIVSGPIILRERYEVRLHRV